MHQRRYPLAREVFQEVTESAGSAPSRYKGRLTKAVEANIHDCLNYCLRMEETNSWEGKRRETGRTPGGGAGPVPDAPSVKPADVQAARAAAPAPKPEEELP